MTRKPNNDDFERADFHSNQKCLITSTDQTKLNLYDNNDSHINENNFITISQKDEHTLQNINSKNLINYKLTFRSDELNLDIKFNLERK